MVEPDLPPPEEGEELGVADSFDDYPIVDRVLDYMEHDPEKEEAYTFLVTGRAAVAELLDQIFSNVDVHPSGPIDDLLRLACAMETEYRSPSAAAEIKSALAADARVRDALSAIEA